MQFKNKTYTIQIQAQNKPSPSFTLISNVGNFFYKFFNEPFRKQLAWQSKFSQKIAVNQPNLQQSFYRNILFFQLVTVKYYTTIKIRATNLIGKINWPTEITRLCLSKRQRPISFSNLQNLDFKQFRHTYMYTYCVCTCLRAQYASMLT